MLNVRRPPPPHPHASRLSYLHHTVDLSSHNTTDTTTNVAPR